MEKKLKSLIESNSEKMEIYLGHISLINNNTPFPNNIACPQCGNELFDTHPNITLSSLPPKKDIHCGYCDYRGYRLA